MLMLPYRYTAEMHVLVILYNAIVCVRQCHYEFTSRQLNIPSLCVSVCLSNSRLHRKHLWRNMIM